MVYTVSTQDTKSKREFCAEANLTHTLLSDVGGKTASAYGVLMPNGMARRVTFYIAPDGTVAEVDTKPSVATAGEDSLATLARLVKARQAGEKVTLGARVPEFALPDARTGRSTALSTLTAGKRATVVLFIATQCPVSNDYNLRMARLAARYAPKGVAFVGINANATEPAAEVAAHARKHRLGFPVLKDTDNAVADRFGASVTPEVYVLDAGGILVYHGAMDDSRDASRVKKRPLAETLDALLVGKPVPVATIPAFGGTIHRAVR